MKLIEPSIEYDKQIQAYRQEFIDCNEIIQGAGLLLNHSSAKDWLDELEQCKDEKTTPNNLVPFSQYIYVRESDHKIVGVIQIRHYFNDYLEKYGGHEMAVGLSLKKENFQKFADKFEEIAKKAHTEEIESVINIDEEITLKDVNIETVESLKALEPFGEANKLPVFIYKNLKIDSIRALSEGKHLKLTLKDGNTIINGIGFNMGKYAEEFRISDKIDVLGVLEINSFNGRDTIQINMRDIRKSY